MALLSPLGLVIPRMAGSSDAWGEWGSETLEKLLGYLPEGLRQTADLWKAPVPDYQLWGEKVPWGLQMASYILSGILGIVLVGGFTMIIVKVLKKRAH
jgi:cobalt/nickel transport protein